MTDETAKLTLLWIGWGQSGGYIPGTLRLRVNDLIIIETRSRVHGSFKPLPPQPRFYSKIRITLFQPYSVVQASLCPTFHGKFGHLFR